MKTLGLDIGTTTISAVVHDDILGVLESKTVKNDAFLKGESWERIQDPLVIYEKAVTAVRALLENHPEVQAIGLTGQMHGIVYLDELGEPVSPLYTWQDGRGDLAYDENHSWAAHLSRITGYPLATGYGLVTHAYHVNHGLVPDGAAKLCTIHDYIAMKFAGLTKPFIDPTDAASLGMFDIPKGCFDCSALKKAGIDRKILPDLITQPCLGIGIFGIPVYAGIGDNQASFMGSTGGRDDVLLVNVGTGSQISVFSPECIKTDTLETRPFPDGGYLLVGASLCGGRSYALLERFFRQTAQMVTGNEVSAYDGMTRMLNESEPVTDYPTISTLFQGTRQDPNLRGCVTGLGIDNFTPLHFMYGVMHGMADELYAMFRGYLDANGKLPSVMIGSGNGLRRNPHLCRIFEETFGSALILSGNNEEAATGAAIYAARHCR